MPDRRQFLQAAAAIAGSLAWQPAMALSAAPLLREIGRSGERLPAVGLGTWRAFDIEVSGADGAQASAALQRLFDEGGRVVDTSPMYGRAEAALGELAQPHATRLYLATKIWTQGGAQGRAQFERSLRLLRRERLDLVQVHNLLDTAAHLRTLREQRERGRVRHIGITHYHAGAHADLMRWMRAEALDFVQVNYSLAEPEAAHALLPLAAERGIAVLVNRPFAEGAMFARVAGREVPAWAREELGCRSWAQCFLKWILAEPAVTCVLCGTRKPAHVADNAGAMFGPLPDAGQRARLAAAWRDGAR
ncbi:MAG: aldo/keto reductase [Xanthomonadales bacterium]|nr:hypothetical protein [Xanthomonadales bacterium]MCC6591733.1 aldo/keto reductase [Xanthomonadales bacterium]MCE7929754.1 aldo/keto reductase [Xanthomonadales bacterium PRO6]